MIEKRERRRRDGTTYAVWRVRWRDETGSERSKTFDRVGDARAFEAKLRLLKRTGALGDLDAGQETLAEFVEEWWQVYAGPNLERSTLRAYAHFWNSHALPRLGQLQLRELTPQVIARFRAELEADGVGNEAIRKTMTMLQGVMARAVEWGRVPTNAVKLTRKPPKKYKPAVQAIPPSVIEHMRARLLERRPGARRRARGPARLRRPTAAGGARARVAPRARAHAARRAGGQRRPAQDAQEPPAAADDRAPRRRSSADLAAWRQRVQAVRTVRTGLPVPGGRLLARERLAQLAQADLPPAGRIGRDGRRPALRPAPRLRVAADPRGPALRRRHRRAARAQPDRLPRHLRARDGRAARRGADERRGADLAGSPGARAAAARAGRRPAHAAGGANRSIRT